MSRRVSPSRTEVLLCWTPRRSSARRATDAAPSGTRSDRAGATSPRNEEDEALSTPPSAIVDASARQAPSPSRGSRSGSSPAATAGTRYWTGAPMAK